MFDYLTVEEVEVLISALRLKRRGTYDTREKKIAGHLQKEAMDKRIDIIRNQYEDALRDIRGEIYR